MLLNVPGGSRGGTLFSCPGVRPVAHIALNRRPGAPRCSLLGRCRPGRAAGTSAQVRARLDRHEAPSSSCANALYVDVG